MMNNLRKMLDETDRRREHDAERWAALDDDACQLCDAHGADKRSLWISCFYAVHEVVPEAIDTFAIEQVPEGRRGHYYLRICKTCRGALFGHLKDWRDERVTLRGQPKDHDGYLEDEDGDSERNIPVRENGAVVMLTRAEWDERQTHD